MFQHIFQKFITPVRPFQAVLAKDINFENRVGRTKIGSKTNKNVFSKYWGPDEILTHKNDNINSLRPPIRQVYIFPKLTSSTTYALLSNNGGVHIVGCSKIISVIFPNCVESQVKRGSDHFWNTWDIRISSGLVCPVSVDYMLLNSLWWKYKLIAFKTPISPKAKRDVGRLSGLGTQYGIAYYYYYLRAYMRVRLCAHACVHSFNVKWV